MMSTNDMGEIYRNYIQRALQGVDATDAAVVSQTLIAAEESATKHILALKISEDHKKSQISVLKSVLNEFYSDEIKSNVDANLTNTNAKSGIPNSFKDNEEHRSNMLSNSKFTTIALAALIGLAGFNLYQTFFQSNCRSSNCHDSGWKLLDGRGNHIVTVEHGLGTLPISVETWFSPDEGKTFARYHGNSWTHSLNPVDMRADAQTVSLHFFSGEPLHKTWTLADGWQSYDKGYFRVITRR